MNANGLFPEAGAYTEDTRKFCGAGCGDGGFRSSSWWTGRAPKGFRAGQARWPPLEDCCDRGDGNVAAVGSCLKTVPLTWVTGRAVIVMVGGGMESWGRKKRPWKSSGVGATKERNER